jgi:hypothetical protein
MWPNVAHTSQGLRRSSGEAHYLKPRPELPGSIAMTAKELALYTRTQCVINELSAFVRAHDKVEYYIR